MRALRWHARGDVRLDEVGIRPPLPGEIQLRVLWCGLCGTDVEEWRDGPIFIPAGAPHPLTGAQAPLTMGHEFTGEVVALGPGAGSLQVGDLVAVDGLMSCGTCRWCRQGRVVLCGQLAQVGLMADGGLADYCNVPSRVCARLPSGLSAEDAVLCETLAVCLRALDRGRLAGGDEVVVVGAGAVGLLTVQAALHGGASRVTVIETHARRRELAVKLGAAEARPPEEASGLRGDLVIECSGNAGAVTRSVQIADKGGRVVLAGITTGQSTFMSSDMVAGEKEIIGTLSHTFDRDFGRAIRLLDSGAADTARLISDRIPLDRVVEDGLTALAESPADHIKIIVSPCV